MDTEQGADSPVSTTANSAAAPCDQDRLGREASQPTPSARSEGGWAFRTVRSLWFHAVLLTLILVGLALLVNNGQPALPDEGLYTAQADNLAQGGWGIVRPESRMDHGNEFGALVGSTIRGDQTIPYARRPLYPLLITPFWAVGGFFGTMLLSVTGTVVAACTSALIGRRLDPRATFWTFWLVGLGSPLLFDSLVVMGHAAAAGLAGLTGLLTISAMDRQRFSSHRALVALGALLFAVLLTLIRSEGIIVVGALAAGTSLSALSLRRRSLRCDWVRLAFGVSLGIVGVAAYIANDFWARRITSGAAGDIAAGDRSPDVLNAAWTGLVRPWMIDARFASTALTILLACAVLAPLTLRFLPKSQLAGLALLGLGAAAAVAHLLEQVILVTGLFAVTPWLVIGLLSLKGKEVVKWPTGLFLFTAAVSTAAILATTYGEGGAAEWGGRFFHPLIPLLAPVAVLSLVDLCSKLPRRNSIWVVACIATMTLAVSVSAVRFLHDEHLRVGRLRDAIIRTEAAHREWHAPVAFAQLPGSGTSRLFWSLGQRGVLVLNAPAFVDVPILLNSVPNDQQHVIVVSNLDGVRLSGFLAKAKVADWEVKSWQPTDAPPYGIAILSRR